MVSIALFAPVVVGRNVTDVVVDAPAASVVAAGAATVNCDASVPVIANGVLSVTASVLALVIVSVAAPIEPVVIDPKSTDGGLTVRTPVTATVNAADPVQSSVAVARTVNVDEPASVGVPETMPSLLSVRPPGSAPVRMLNAYGAVPPLAVSVCEYGVPTTPPGSDPLIVIAGHDGPAGMMSARLRGMIC